MEVVELYDNVYGLLTKADTTDEVSKAAAATVENVMVDYCDSVGVWSLGFGVQEIFWVPVCPD